MEPRSHARQANSKVSLNAWAGLCVVLSFVVAVVAAANAVVPNALLVTPAPAPGVGIVGPCKLLAFVFLLEHMTSESVDGLNIQTLFQTYFISPLPPRPKLNR